MYLLNAQFDKGLIGFSVATEAVNADNDIGMLSNNDCNFYKMQSL